VPEPPPVLAGLVSFVRVLRAAGVVAGTDRLVGYASALATLDATSRRDVYWAGRLTLCGGPDDLRRYDNAFAAVFDGAPTTVPTTLRPRPLLQAMPTVLAMPVDEPGEQGERERVTAAASTAEVLRERDIADLSRSEQAMLQRLLSAFALPGETRPSRRWTPAHRGAVDASRTVREALRDGGETARLHRRRHRVRPRRVVLLVDVSGSMAAYADALLRFAHAARRGWAPTEVFTIGTRLTRISRELSHRDPDTAMRAVAAAVPDWSGGTRLGAMLRQFLDVWGQRGVARGAVVVLLTDGWEREDPALLGQQVARLHRLASRVVWANPRIARPGFAPLAAGVAAVLPHVDDVVAGNSLASLEHLAEVVAGRRRAPGAAGPALAEAGGAAGVVA